MSLLKSIEIWKTCEKHIQGPLIRHPKPTLKQVNTFTLTGTCLEMLRPMAAPPTWSISDSYNSKYMMMLLLPGPSPCPPNQKPRMTAEVCSCLVEITQSTELFISGQPHADPQHRLSPSPPTHSHHILTTFHEKP